MFGKTSVTDLSADFEGDMVGFVLEGFGGD
jgi:hypothetical protein